MAEVNQTARAHRLYEASIERMDTAYQCLRRDDWVAAMYLAGLSVECILQALARLDQRQPDARHDLNRWASKCSPDLLHAIRSQTIGPHWNRVVNEWRNDLRYFSKSQLLGYLKRRSNWNSLKGDNTTKMKVDSERFVNSAYQILDKGLIEWHRKTK